MKILHFSDTHVGIDTHGTIDPDTKLNIRTLDVLDSLDAMIDMAVEENIDLALFAGDAFHRHSPNQSHVNEFGKRILRLRKHCPVVLLVGNHDMPGGDRASALEIYKTLEVEDVVIAKNCEILQIETKSGVVQVVTIPYPNKSWINLKTSGRIDTTEMSRLLKEETTSRIQKLAKRVDKTLPTILLGHFTVEGCQFGSERPLLVSAYEAAVSLEELVLPVWDYVALGHIHKHQNISKDMEYVPPIVYSGSIDRVDFGEEKDSKGFVLLEIIDKKVTWEFIDVNARPFYTLEYNVRGKEATDKILNKIDTHKSLDGAVVRVIITPADTITHLSLDEDKIKTYLLDKGVFLINRFTVKRPEDLATEQGSKRGIILDTMMKPAEMLTAYLDSIGKSDKEIRSLGNLFADIQHTCEVENVKPIREY
ncbi:MAG: exonuclease SbcCD subunit D [Candidatus Izemoplasmatales bacterium]